MSIERIQKTLDSLYQDCAEFNCPPGFKALVISDLHLGIGDEADDFRGNDKDFITVVGGFLGQGFTLILLGDYLDLWENGDSSEIVRAHPLVCQLIEQFRVQRRVIQLVGNHDGSLPYPDALKLLLPSRKILFLTHGHRGDWACDQAGWIGRAFVRYIWAGIGQRVFGLHDPTSARSDVNPGKHEEVRQMYNGWANDRRIHMVWGHTHFGEEVGFTHNDDCWIGQHRGGYTIEDEQLTYHNFA
jgi:predicted phosphodiesterase